MSSILIDGMGMPPKGTYKAELYVDENGTRLLVDLPEPFVGFAQHLVREIPDHHGNANESMSMEDRFRRCVQELIDIAKESECPSDILQQVADEFAKAARSVKGSKDDR